MQLGGAPARLFDQARDGDVDIVWTAPMLTPGRFPKIEMFDLPFVPSRRALVGSKALADFAAANLKDEFREVRPLCFSCTDRGVLHTNQPIRTVEDIKDLKIHVPTRWAGEALRQLGAQPVPMPPGQLQMALNQTCHRWLSRPLAFDAGAAAQRCAQDAHRFLRFIAKLRRPSCWR